MLLRCSSKASDILRDINLEVYALFELYILHEEEAKLFKSDFAVGAEKFSLIEPSDSCSIPLRFEKACKWAPHFEFIDRFMTHGSVSFEKSLSLLGCNPEQLPVFRLVVPEDRMTSTSMYDGTKEACLMNESGAART